MNKPASILLKVTAATLVVGALFFGTRALIGVREDVANQNEAARAASAAQQAAVLAKQNQPEPDADSSWSVDNTIDKMTGGRRNRLVKIADAGVHRYEFTFACDADGMAQISASTYFAQDGKGAEIPWESHTKDFRLRFGDELVRLTLKPEGYDNVGIAELTALTKVERAMAAMIPDETERRRKLAESDGVMYKALAAVLTQDVINVADIFPGEVVELNPSKGRIAVGKFLAACSDRIQPSPSGGDRRTSPSTASTLQPVPMGRPQWNQALPAQPDDGKPHRAQVIVDPDAKD